MLLLLLLYVKTSIILIIINIYIFIYFINYKGFIYERDINSKTEIVK